MKTCFKCNLEKDYSHFYAHKRMADGYLSKCKECAKKDVKENYKKNREYYREYERQRADLPHRVELRTRYAATERGKERQAAGSSAWIKRNGVKRKAHHALGNAVRDGRIEKPCACDQCGCGGAIDGHHPDYNRPLDVIWLCRSCHSALHKDHRRQLEARQKVLE